jgi:uncharacterized metal-binding protein YceD (DUF177 family)
MKLDVKKLVVAPFGQKESFNLEYFNEKIDEDILAERTRGKLDLTRLEEEIVASFVGGARVRMTCDRCLVEFCTEIPLKFRAEFIMGQKTEEEESFYVSRQFEIDIWEALRQEISSRVPVKKLCQQECKGICVDCGKNKNSEPCKCKSIENNRD